MFLAKLFMFFDGVLRDAQNNRSGLAEILGQVSEVFVFNCASRRIVARVEENHDGRRTQVRQGDGVSAVLRQGEIRGHFALFRQRVGFF